MGKQKRTFINVGGISIIVGLGIHIVANMFIKKMPPQDPNFEELSLYLSSEVSSWAIVHGLRYAAIVCIVLFACALYMKTTSGEHPENGRGWQLVGLFGAILMMANLLITNAVEILAFLDFSELDEQESLFWLLFNLTRVLFTTEIITWGIFIFGFSMAGIIGGSFPRWISYLGIVCGVFCLFAAVFVVNIFQGGGAGIIIEIGTITGLLWFISTGIYMLPALRTSK